MINVIENLIKDEHGMYGNMHCKWLEQQLEVMIAEDVSIEYASLCADSLNSINDNLINDICRAAIAYAEEFCEMVGQEPPKVNAIRDILQYIEFGTLQIDEPEDESIPVVHLGGGCDWEPEHGIEMIIRNGELIYLGAYNGEWAWGNSEQYEEDYNYAYVIKHIKNKE